MTDSHHRRVAVIGDVGGHLITLRAELARLGADDDRLPEDLIVVQVGDLVHRGPSSDAVVALVDHYLRAQPGQWIQLVGNHEAQYLREPVFVWPERIGPESIRTLRRWWSTGQMVAATSLATSTPNGTESFLITHAGLTRGFWRDVLGAPARADDAAASLNAMIGRDDQLFRPGTMLHGRKVDPAAGPLWAAAATELVPSWVGNQLPFSQLHGHTSIVDWDHAPPIVTSADDEIIRRTTVDVTARHETTVLPGGRVIGIDPCHGHQARAEWHAWEASTTG